MWRRRSRGISIYLCILFESRVEIKKNTVPVDVVYQIIRAFIEFKNCVVIFVTAKKSSENLMNYIKITRFIGMEYRCY